MRISDWSSDVCSSGLADIAAARLVVADGLAALRDLRAMDEDAFLPVRRPRGIVAGDDAVLAGDVDAAEKAADRVGHRLAALFVDVEDRDLLPPGHQRPCARTADAGGTAGADPPPLPPLTEERPV